MVKTASRISLRRGAIGRSTRGVVPRRAQVTVIGMLAKVEVSADRGTSTLHVETTLALTSRGAAADWPCAKAGALARITAATTVRIITLQL
jgi:hypothetical protein